MVRFAIMLLLLAALALWNLPEFRTWGRNDRRDEALTRSSIYEVLAKADKKAASVRFADANAEATYEPRPRR